MPSPEILDFESLVAPIDGERPAGENLREDISPTSVYYQIKDARAGARAAERAAASMGEIDESIPGEWRTILSQAPTVIASRAKDLEISAWLIEALVRYHGYAGLRDGFRLVRELVDTYWDDIYPLPDEDGIETRVAPLTGLNGEDAEGTLIVPIALIKVTGDGDHGELSLWQYRQARDLSRLDDPEALAERVRDGALSLEAFQATVALTDPQLFVDVLADLDGAIEEFDAMTRALDERAGNDSPPSSNIRRALADAKETLVQITRDVIGHLTEDGDGGEAVEESAEGGGEVQPAARPGGPPGAITTRSEAFATLQRVAKFFQTTEPHSPIPSLLDQAVRWGNMPFAKLMSELIPDESAREHFSLVTGVRKLDDPYSSDDD